MAFEKLTKYSIFMYVYFNAIIYKILIWRMFIEFIEIC